MWGGGGERVDKENDGLGWVRLGEVGWTGRQENNDDEDEEEEMVVAGVGEGDKGDGGVEWGSAGWGLCVLGGGGDLKLER